jgi:urea transport system substrate-binding protein
MRKLLTYAAVGVVAALASGYLLKTPLAQEAVANTGSPIKVGVLHSLTGTMSVSEKAVADATLMAIDEINSQGGVLGRRIEPVVANGASDWPTFAREAERLIVNEKVATVFGCWTSASRKTVKPVFEKYNHLLFYPVQYEGFEASPNIVYTGSTPNQQLTPAVQWSFDHLGKRFYIIGSDYIFPKMASEVFKEQIKALGGEVVGEKYLLLGNRDVNSVIDDIIAKKPDVILNTINGDSNWAFFKMLQVKNTKIPVMSFSIGESEIKSIGTDLLAGHYASWTYFQSIDSNTNLDFIRRFKAKYGQDQTVNDPVEAAYTGVYLWTQAVAKAGSDDVAAIRQAVKQQSFNAPQGTVMIDPHNNHTWKTVRIGQIQNNGQFSIVWASSDPVRPIPYLASRNPDEWDQVVEGYYKQWNSSWANPILDPSQF